MIAGPTGFDCKAVTPREGKSNTLIDRMGFFAQRDDRENKGRMQLSSPSSIEKRTRSMWHVDFTSLRNRVLVEKAKEFVILHFDCEFLWS